MATGLGIRFRRRYVRSDDGEGKLSSPSYRGRNPLFSLSRPYCENWFRGVFSVIGAWFWFLIDETVLTVYCLHFPLYAKTLRLACVVSCEVATTSKDFPSSAFFRLFRIVPVCDGAGIVEDWVVPSVSTVIWCPFGAEFCAIGGTCASRKYVHCSTPLGLGLWIDFFSISSCIRGE